MGGKGTRRNDRCPCGSGKKYKDCCRTRETVIKEACRKDATFTLDNGSTVERPIKSIDSIPTHNSSGLQPEVSKEELMDLCLDQIETRLCLIQVSMFADIVDDTIQQMDVVPTFTYREIAERMQTDARFELHMHQVCSLKGTNPLELLADRL